MKKLIFIAVVIVVAILLIGCSTKKEPTKWSEYVVHSGDTVCDIAIGITPENTDYRETEYYIIEKNNIRFDVNVSAGEDVLFICDYFSTCLSKMRTISRPLYHYYISNNESLSNRNVNFKTTEYVLDCLKERIDMLSMVYHWNSDEGYKRHISTQFNNFIAYIMRVPSLVKRAQLLKRVMDNRHIRFLFSDLDYIVKRKRLSGIRAYLFKICVLPLKLYYLFN